MPHGYDDCGGQIQVAYSYAWHPKLLVEGRTRCNGDSFAQGQVPQWHGTRDLISVMLDPLLYGGVTPSPVNNELLFLKGKHLKFAVQL